MPINIHGKQCSVDGCENNTVGRGMCRKHYLRWWRYGDPLFVKNERHGMKNTPEYSIWSQMISRCYVKNNKSYKNYGGRGIKVCRRWRYSFSNFYKDMGEREGRLQLDRINNDGDYSPENCEWVTHERNSQHTRNTRLSIEKAREIRILSKEWGIKGLELSRIYGVTPQTISHILRNKQWKEVSNAC